MKLLISILALVIAFQTFARDHQEDRDRADRAREQRRRNEEDRRRREENVNINIFDITNTLYLSSWTFDEKEEASQIVNDSQEFMTSGNLSILLNQKINEIQKVNQDLSLEDAIDLIVDSAKAKL